MSDFTTEQKNYFQGFAMGVDVARTARQLPVLGNINAGNINAGNINAGNISRSNTSGAAAGASGTPNSVAGQSITLGSAASTSPGFDPARLDLVAQHAAVARGQKLCAEEAAKRDKDPLAFWDEMQRNASTGKFPKGTDVLLYKFSGLFYVAPAQDSYMCRLRFPGGDLPAYQLRGLADLAEKYAGGYADATTRGNLQLREIPAEHALNLLAELQELGIVPRGSGADNVRNITASATSGFDADEWIETLPLAKQLNHYILNHREMYCLPRKFNISFEGGGAIATLEETNDIGFQAVQVSEAQATSDVSAGFYFRLVLGGITGHKDFARETGVLVRADETTEVSAAVLRVFIRHGDRTDRKRARLKYLLDDWGFPKFLTEVERELGRPLLRISSDRYSRPPAPTRESHVGVRPQKQMGLHYLGVLLPVGRMTADQMRGIANLAERFGKRHVRLTVWQNLLIPYLSTKDLAEVQEEIVALGLNWNASSVRAGLVACTGSKGCKFASADTKGNALQLADYLEERLEIDVPINLHLTGCPNSCAQHYIGDIGLQATKVEVGDDMVDGYHLCVGGGYADAESIGRVLESSVPFADIPPLVERLVMFYLDQRYGQEEPFALFTRRHSLEELREAVKGYALL